MTRRVVRGRRRLVERAPSIDITSRLTFVRSGMTGSAGDPVRRWPRFFAGTVSVSGHGPIMLELARDMRHERMFNAAIPGTRNDTGRG